MSLQPPRGGTPLRATRQRRSITAVLAGSERPLTPAEILARARHDLPSLGIATVYRSLRDGLDDGSLRAVEVPGATTHYEVASHGHHHHFHCTGCGRVYEVHGCPGDLARLAPPGFAVDGHEITLSGRCRECLSGR